MADLFAMSDKILSEGVADGPIKFLLDRRECGSRKTLSWRRTSGGP